MVFLANICLFVQNEYRFMEWLGWVLFTVGTILYQEDFVRVGLRRWVFIQRRKKQSRKVVCTQLECSCGQIRDIYNVTSFSLIQMAVALV